MHWFCGFEHIAAKPWVHLFAGQATASEKRVCSSSFALMPLMLVSFAYFGPACFGRGESLGAALFFAGLLVVGGLWLMVCVKFIPASVSWVLGSAIWLAVLAWALSAYF